jgi:hypothetical protein
VSRSMMRGGGLFSIIVGDHPSLPSFLLLAGRAAAYYQALKLA